MRNGRGEQGGGLSLPTNFFPPAMIHLRAISLAFLICASPDSFGQRTHQPSGEGAIETRYWSGTRSGIISMIGRPGRPSQGCRNHRTPQRHICKDDTFFS